MMKKEPTDEPLSFEEAAAQERDESIVREFIRFLAHNKRWWLLPIFLILLLLGVITMMTSTSAFPFIYSLF